MTQSASIRSSRPARQVAHPRAGDPAAARHDGDELRRLAKLGAATRPRAVPGARRRCGGRRPRRPADRVGRRIGSATRRPAATSAWHRARRRRRSRRAARRPIRASSSTIRGLAYSAQALGRGWRARSTTTTRAPARDSPPQGPSLPGRSRRSARRRGSRRRRGCDDPRKPGRRAPAGREAGALESASSSASVYARRAEVSPSRRVTPLRASARVVTKVAASGSRPRRRSFTTMPDSGDAGHLAQDRHRLGGSR